MIIADFFPFFLRNIQTSIQNLLLYGEIIEKDSKQDVESLYLQFPWVALTIILISKILFIFCFSHLRSLSINDHIAIFYDEAFVNCKNLEELFINLHNSVSQSALNAIRNSLKTNSKLKLLSLSYGSFFHADFLSGITLKLTKFQAYKL